MQPHSMAFASAVNYYWNRPHDEIVHIKKCMVRVEYQTGDGTYKNNYYELSNFYESSDRRELRAYVMRSSGDIKCEMTARRSSLSEGSEIVMTHGQQHIAGLREIFYMYRKKISSGRHENSLKYGKFEGEAPFYDRVKLYCEVRNRNGSFVTVPYDLEIDSIDRVITTPATEPQPTKQEPTPGKIINFPGFGQNRKAA